MSEILASASPLSLAVAFAAGLFSFLSPCVLPLVPTYISFLTGGAGLAPAAATGAGSPSGSADAFAVDAADLGLIRRRALGQAIGFSVGFSLVFIAFGYTASSLGQLLGLYAPLIRRLSGLAIIVFGLHTAGVLHWLALDRTRTMDVRPPASLGGPLGSVFIGVNFAAGWTPCIGPVLASILLAAGNGPSAGYGLILLSAYAAGLAVPFLATALSVGQFLRWLKPLRRHLATVQVVSGALLVLMGILVFGDAFTIISQYVRWPF